MQEVNNKLGGHSPSEGYVFILILHKKRKGKMAPDETVKAVYDYLISGNVINDISIDALRCHDNWLKNNIQSGWNLEALIKGYYNEVENITKVKTIGGYTVKELFEDMQGVTTGGNEYFVFTQKHYSKWKKTYSVPDNVELVYDCIDGEDIEPFKVIYRKKILFPYVTSDDNDKWKPAFQLDTGKDALDFSINLVENERSYSNVEDRLSARVARGLIPQELIGIARYLVLNYNNLRGRRYEGKLIEEYSGVWYGFHRVRSPKILTIPNIVTPRVVQKPRFAVNTRRAIPLDTVIVLIPKDDLLGNLLNDLKYALKREVQVLDVLYYVTALLNSTISETILKVKATKVKGGYYTIDEKYLSEMVIPKPSPEDKDLIEEMIRLAQQCTMQQHQCNASQVLIHADDLYKKTLRRA